ncbi:hypothetical protein IU440_24400 [Nocardia cyriacigeorgica]|nr:hypothetical protein [Nocardia cyriacigeorgica]
MHASESSRRTPNPPSYPSPRRQLPRSCTFSRTRLATLTMQLGDPCTAAALGRQAVTDATHFHSQRIRDELTSLAAAATPHRRITEVADLCHTITALPKLEAIP